jgi:hypothetical protein
MVEETHGEDKEGKGKAGRKGKLHKSAETVDDSDDA